MPLFTVNIVNPLDVGRDTITVVARDAFTAIFIAGAAVAETARAGWLVSSVAGPEATLCSPVIDGKPEHVPTHPTTPLSRLECLRAQYRAAQMAYLHHADDKTGDVYADAITALGDYALHHGITYVEARDGK